MGSVEGGAVVGRRLTTLPTKATHELAKKASLLEKCARKAEGSVVLGADLVVTLEGAVPLCLWPNSTALSVTPHLLFFLSLSPPII